MTSAPRSHPGVDRLAAQARAALTDPAPATGEQEPSRPATGTAADGRVRAVVGADGRLRSLDIAPELLGHPLEDITAAARTAINAAFDALPGGPDVAPVVDLIRDTQALVRRDLGRVSTALADVAAAVRSRPQGGRF